MARPANNDFVSVSVKLENAGEVRRALRSLDVDLSDMVEVNVKVADFVIARARSIGPKRSGALVGSLRPSKSKNRVRILVGSARVPYAGPIHWGWPNRPKNAPPLWGGPIAANPFVSRAAQETEPAWQAIYAHEIQKLCDAAQRRAS